MRIHFKISGALLASIRTDLRRPHHFAHERVGFIAAGLAAAHDSLLLIARQYRPLHDDEYLLDRSVGAMMNADAIRRARQWAMDERAAIFHVHAHSGRGLPAFSPVDVRENTKFVPNFVAVAPQAAHGAIVLSDTAAVGQVWLGRGGVQPFINSFSEVGAPLRHWSAA
jgi:hypothetical protein